MRKPLFYLLVPLVLASKISQILKFFLETFLGIVFTYFVLILYEIAPFWDPFEIKWGPKGAHFGISGTEKAPKATRWASKIWSVLVPFPPAAALTSPASPRGPPGLIFNGCGSHFDQLWIFSPNFFRFRTQGKNKSSKLKILFKQQRSRAPQTEHQQHNALIVTPGTHF
jgi:hypothetical protein